MSTVSELDPEAFARFGRALRKMSTAFRDFGRAFALGITKSPKDRRRLQRDWARMDRRPALIHKGGKP